MKICPVCKLTNPDESITCDCGCNFEDQMIYPKVPLKPDNIQKSNIEAMLENCRYSIISARYLAYVIDLSLLLLITYLTISNYSEFKGTSLDIFGRILVGILLLIILLYHPVLEGVFGITPGKYLVKVRVVNNELKPPGIFRAALRMLVKIFEIVLAGGIFSVLIMLSNKKRQRLGDMAAGTYVVHSRNVKCEDKHKIKIFFFILFVYVIVLLYMYLTYNLLTGK